ncbi:sulfotransferase [Spirulina major CS-329]|uniref:sulfotransferase family protein n=1 Tax=Spirulina TaxID=1154 RepID=UPI00232F3820|nr:MULTISPECIES: sulfotransferase [Spirulina]MDB9496999.1 sulfotransferase [Spirulina subsalsa CS-330]MDB9505189.1 sulfotransferase [Spirulina major CS-329]
MPDPSTLDSVIKSPALIVHQSTAPVIVVGLPRSGSSYLAHVLSCLEGWFVFDDLYPYQKAAALGISSRMNLAQKPKLLKDYINSITWQLRAKIKYEENFDVPNLTWDDTFAMETALCTALEGQDPLTWPQVLEEWITRLAFHSQKQRWGYKTPQDFLHLDELATLFPGVRFVYILRDPRKMMRSFKSLPRVKTHGSQDGESRQYHPLVYSLYWKKSYEAVQSFMKRDRAPVETIKFEDLVKTPEAVADRLARFLDTQVVGNVVLEKGNSSSDQGKNKELTATEIFICEKMAGASMRSAGYTLTNPTPKLGDLFDLIGTSFVFATYQLQRMIKDPKARTSIFSFLKSLIGKKS